MALKASIAGFFAKFVNLNVKNTAAIGSSKIGDDLIFETEVSGQFFRVWETKTVSDPDEPDLFSGTYSEKWFNTNLCGADDKIRIRYRGLACELTFFFAYRHYVSLSKIIIPSPSVNNSSGLGGKKSLTGLSMLLPEPIGNVLGNCVGWISVVILRIVLRPSLALACNSAVNGIS